MCFIEGKTFTKSQPLEVKIEQPPGPLVMTFKETVTSSSSLDLVAEVEKQYVAITPPNSPEPPPGMVRFGIYIHTPLPPPTAKNSLKCPSVTRGLYIVCSNLSL